MGHDAHWLCWRRLRVSSFSAKFLPWVQNMVTKPPAGVPSHLTAAETAIESAKAACNDAAQIRLALATLEAYGRHRRDILKKLEDDRTNVLNCVWCSLWWHLITLIGRAYALRRKSDDRHAQVAFELLNNHATRNAVAALVKGNDAVLEQAIDLWAQYGAHSKIRSVIDVRNKQIAHWAGFEFDWTTLEDNVLPAARMTADVMEKLAQGVGVTAPPFVDYSDEAEMFWTSFLR
jgi:hypothetical protein